MGDSGEGLIDAESRIQERMEELARERDQKKAGKVVRDPEKVRALELLKLARTELERQWNTTAHAGRKVQLGSALEDIDRRIAEARARLDDVEPHG